MLAVQAAGSVVQLLACSTCRQLLADSLIASNEPLYTAQGAGQTCARSRTSLQHVLLVTQGSLTDTHPNPRAREVDLRSKQDELAAATAERDTVRGSYDGLRKARLDGFMAGESSGL